MSRSLRIAMVAACPFPRPRGTPVRIFRMAEALAGRGHDVHVVTYHHGDEKTGPMQIHRTPEIPSYRKYSPGPTLLKLVLLDPLLARRLVGVLRDYEIDVIHAHHYEGLLVGAWARFRTGRPVIFDAHTLLETELPSYGSFIPRGVKKVIGGTIDRILPRWADHVVSVTERIRGSLICKSRLDPDRVSVVSNGVEIENFENCSRPAQAESSVRKIVFTGNLTAYQGIELMLDAFEAVARERPDVRLLIVTRESFDAYEDRARSLGIRDRIDMVPSSFDTIPELLSQATVALNPRVDCDGIPQKLLNYMAAGLPTVSFEGSAPCVDHDKTGWIVPKGDHLAFARGILRFLDDDGLAHRIGSAGRELVRTYYTWEEAARKMEPIYAKLVGR